MTISNNNQQYNIFTSYKPSYYYNTAAKYRTRAYNREISNSDKTKALIGSTVGTAIPLMLMMKKQNIKNPLKLKYGMWDMVATATGAIIGGVGVGLIGEEKDIQNSENIRQKTFNRIFNGKNGADAPSAGNVGRNRNGNNKLSPPENIIRNIFCETVVKRPFHIIFGDFHFSVFGARPVDRVFANKDISFFVRDKIIGLCCVGHRFKRAAEKLFCMLGLTLVGKVVFLCNGNYIFCVSDERIRLIVPPLA